MSGERSKRLVCLGLDHGSTFTRATLLCPASEQVYDVENIDLRDEFTNKHAGTGFNEFSSYGCPFEERPAGHVGPWHLYEDTWRPEHKRRRHESLKYGMYLLSRADKELLDQYPHTSPLTDRKDDAAFVARVRKALVELFTVVRRRVDRVCEIRGLRFEEIALSIPDQWDVRFQNVYEAIVLEAFGPGKSVSFVTESEALAHHVINENFYEVKQKDFDKIIFLDFGGHSMSASLFHVALSDAKEKAYCEIGVPSGVAGGSELWEYIIGEATTESILESTTYMLTTENKASFLQKFAAKKRSLGSSTKTNTKIAYEDLKGNTQSWVLSPDLIRSSWKAAFEGPLKQARESIANARSAPGSLGVVISGGSVYNLDLEKQLRQICREEYVTPMFTTEMESRRHTMNIATGAAFAVGKRITVAEFFDRGAAVGLQMRDVDDPDNPDDTPWEDVGAFLMDRDSTNPYQDTLNDKTRMKLICDPFFIRRGEGLLRPMHSYDLLTFAKKKPGLWKFKVSLVTEEGVSCLVMQEIRRENAHQRGRPKARDTITTVFPLYFDGGNNCMHVDWDGMPADTRRRFELDTGLHQPEPAPKAAQEVRPSARRAESPPRIVSDVGRKRSASEMPKSSGGWQKRARVEFGPARRE